jgi:hypothetical protein
VAVLFDFDCGCSLGWHANDFEEKKKECVIFS